MTQRVLHIVGRMDRAGAETMLMNYYRSIDRNRLQFDFLVYTDEVCDYDAEIESLGGRVIRLGGSASWFARTAAIIRILRSGSWSAIHSHTNFSSIFPLFAARVARVPVRVAHAHGTAIETASAGKAAYQAVAPSLIRVLATRKVACGKEAARLLYSADEEVLILPNSVDVPAFTLDREAMSNKVRAELGIASGTRILLQVARLDPVKNPLFLVEVAAKLRAIGQDFVMLLVGRGDMEPAIKEAVGRHGLGEHVRLLGVRTDIPQLLNAADAFLLPSYFEGLPVVLVEAQAAGVPCYVSDRVSAEADLGVGLMSFHSIPDALDSAVAAHHVAAWADALFAPCTGPRLSSGERAAVLKAAGYCASDAMERLTKLYGIA